MQAIDDPAICRGDSVLGCVASLQRNKVAGRRKYHVSASVLMRFTGLENRTAASFCDWPKGSEMKTQQATSLGGCGKIQPNFGNQGNKCLT